MRMKNYPVKGEKVFYDKESEITSVLVSYGYPRWKAKLIGGYAFFRTNEIHIRESRREDIKLLNHERGHLRGLNHTYFPTLMFPCWIGRIFNIYFPHVIKEDLGGEA